MNILALGLVVLPLAASQLLGGFTTADVNRDDIQQMASFALTQLNTLLGSQNTLVSVVKAKTQVVEGVNYFLTLEIQNGQETQICTVTVWSRVWLNDKQVTQHACTSRSKRDGLLGGLTSVDVTRTDILKMATYAVTSLNGLLGTHNSLDQVISAKTQVVSGMNYFLKIRMSDGSQTQICDVTIWDQPWSYMTQLTQHNCVNAKKRDVGIPGGVTNADVNSPEIRNMTDFALGLINELQGAQNSMEQIISAQTQVVAGMNYMLTILLKEGDKTQICKVTIWSQPWLNRKEMTEHSCSQVTKRGWGPLGSPIDVDVNSTEIQQVATFAVAEMNGVEGTQNSLVKVVNAKKQVVSGLNYILTLSLQNGDKTTLCEVRLWYQSWTSTRRLTDHHCTTQTKRQLGAVTDANVNDQFIQMLAHYAVQTANALDGTHRTYDELISVKTQVVAGTNYFFKIRVHKGPTTLLCDITLWRQVWMNSMGHVTEHNCEAARRRSLGGVRRP